MNVAQSKDFSFDFSPEAAAAMYEAENAMTRIDEAYASDEILRAIRNPILAIEASSAIGAPSAVVKEVSVLQLLHDFNYQNKKSDNFNFYPKPTAVIPST